MNAKILYNANALVSPEAGVFFRASDETEGGSDINRLKKAMRLVNELIRRYRADMPYRARISLYASLLMNLFYASFKLISGIYYTSFWYGADAVFLIVLSGMRLFMIRQVRKRGGGLVQEYRQYRFCGCMLFALNVAFIGVIIQIVNHGMEHQYPGHIIYVVAISAFFFLSLAIKNMVIYHKLNSPVLSAVMSISLAKALVALFALQNSMLISFGNGGGISETTMKILNVFTGSVVCLIMFGMAVYMIIRANMNLKGISKGASI